MENKDKRQVVSDVLKGIKLHNAGYTPPKLKKGQDMCCSIGMGKDGVIYPTLYINSKNVPELKGYDVEDEVTMLIKAKISSHSLDERKDNSRENWDLQIKEIAVLDKKEDTKE